MYLEPEKRRVITPRNVGKNSQILRNPLQFAFLTNNNNNNNKLYLHDHNKALQYCKSYLKLLIDSL